MPPVVQEEKEAPHTETTTEETNVDATSPTPIKKKRERKEKKSSSKKSLLAATAIEPEPEQEQEQEQEAQAEASSNLKIGEAEAAVGVTDDKSNPPTESDASVLSSSPLGTSISSLDADSLAAAAPAADDVPAASTNGWNDGFDDWPTSPTDPEESTANDPTTHGAPSSKSSSAIVSPVHVDPEYVADDEDAANLNDVTASPPASHSADIDIDLPIEEEVQEEAVVPPSEDADKSAVTSPAGDATVPASALPSPPSSVLAASASESHPTALDTNGINEVDLDLPDHEAADDDEENEHEDAPMEKSLPSPEAHPHDTDNENDADIVKPQEDDANDEEEPIASLVDDSSHQDPLVEEAIQEPAQLSPTMDSHIPAASDADIDIDIGANGDLNTADDEQAAESDTAMSPEHGVDDGQLIGQGATQSSVPEEEVNQTETETKAETETETALTTEPTNVAVVTTPHPSEDVDDPVLESETTATPKDEDVQPIPSEVEALPTDSSPVAASTEDNDPTSAHATTPSAPSATNIPTAIAITPTNHPSPLISQALSVPLPSPTPTLSPTETEEASSPVADIATKPTPLDTSTPTSTKSKDVSHNRPASKDVAPPSSTVSTTDTPATGRVASTPAMPSVSVVIPSTTASMSGPSSTGGPTTPAVGAGTPNPVTSPLSSPSPSSSSFSSLTTPVPAPTPTDFQSAVDRARHAEDIVSKLTRLLKIRELQLEKQCLEASRAQDEATKSAERLHDAQEAAERDRMKLEKKYNELQKQLDAERTLTTQLQQVQQSARADAVHKADSTESLRLALQAKDSQIAAVMEEGAELQRKQQKLETIIKNLRKDVTAKDESLKKSDLDRVALEKTMAEFTTKFSDLKDRYQHMKADFQEATQKASQAESRVHELERLNEHSQLSINDLRYSLQQSQDTLRERENDLLKLRHELNTSHRIKKDEMAEVEKLKEGEKKSSEREENLLRNLRELQSTLESERAALQQKDEHYQSELAALHLKLQQSEHRNEELISAVPAATRPLLRQIESLTSALSSSKEAWSSLESSLQKRQHEMELQLVKLRHAASSHESDLRQREVELEEVQTRLRTLNDKYAQLETQHRTLKSSHAQLEEQANEKETKLKDLTHELEQLQCDKEELKDRLKSLSDNGSTSEKKMEQMYLHEKSLREKFESQLDQLKLHASSSGSAHPPSSASSTTATDSSAVGPTTPHLADPWTSVPSASASPGGFNFSSDRLAVTSTVEMLRSLVQQKDGEIKSLKELNRQIEAGRASIADELVLLTSQLNAASLNMARIPQLESQLAAMTRRHDAACLIIGEKEEELEDLRGDLAQAKQMFQTQITQLCTQIEEMKKQKQ